MKKHFLSFLALVLSAHLMWATISDNTPTSAAALKSTYYAGADNKSGAALFTALTSISGGVTYSYTKLTYDELYTAYLTCDVYPAGHENAGKLWDMYSTTLWVPGQKECGNYSSEGGCYNREHSMPKSWFGGSNNYKSTNQGCDLVHLVPTDGYVNSMRSNWAFGEVASANYTSNGGLSKRGSSVTSISVEESTVSGTSVSVSGTTVFEPADEYKGDFARIYMYMRARYASLNLAQADGGQVHFTNTTTPASDSKYGFKDYSVLLLMKWHRQDPVSQKEIDRNNMIERKQGNRNPFVDYPALAEYLWGKLAGQTFDLDNVLGSFEATFIPGVSDGILNGSTPDPGPGPDPVTVKYGLTWSVNGSVLRTDSIKENEQPSELPATPTSCSTESNVFRGWTDAMINGTSDTEPDVLYKEAGEIPALTEDITLYAVFAKKTIEQSSGVSSTDSIAFAEQSFTEKQVVTEVKQNKVTITFDKGSNNNAPSYYDPAVRVYGGGTMTVTADNITQIDLYFATGDKTNAITANVGSYTEPTWTGKANEVIFTVGGTSGHRRFATVKVTTNGTGEKVSYTRYITSCQTATEVETTQEKQVAKKVLIGGEIYILVGEQLFTITGQRIR